MKASATGFLGLCLCAPLATSCGWFRPAPPRVSVRAVDVTGATTAGVGLRVRLVLNNPNSYDVRMNWVSSHVWVNERDLGAAQVTNPVTLPSHRDVEIASEVSIPWGEIPGLLLTTANTENIPYRLEGSTNAGARGIFVTATFRSQGTIPRQLIVDAANRQTGALPGTASTPGTSVPASVPSSFPTSIPTSLPTSIPTSLPGGLSIPNIPGLPMFGGSGTSTPASTPQ